MRRVWLTLAFAACVPDLGVRDSLVTRTEILAVRAEPPEAAPGAMVHYDLLVASPGGALTAPPASWGYCTSAKLLAENGAVSASCLADSGVSAVAAGPAAIDAPIPSNACQVFGPDVTSGDLRPRDPDITGGYFQPLRVVVGDQIAYALERVSCSVANAPADAATEFKARYTANKNPVLDPIAASVALDVIPRGARVNFRATWPADSAESYVVFDEATVSVIAHREALRVSWFATAGSFDSDRTGRADTEPEIFTDNGWTAPTGPETAHVFVVLRDDRGGSTFATFDAIVR